MALLKVFNELLAVRQKADGFFFTIIGHFEISTN
jgi:hypothetical protein